MISEKLIGLLFAISGASLIFRRGDFGSSFVPKLFELSIVLMAILLLARHGGRKIYDEARPFIRFYGLLASLLFFFIIIGQVVGNFSGKGVGLEREVFFDYLRLFASILGFFVGALLIQLGYGKKYFHWFLMITIFSPLVLLPAWTSWGARLYVGELGRLWGTYNDPNYLGSWLAAIFLLGLPYLFEKKGWQKFGLFFWLVVIAALILWTSSRGAWSVLFIGLAIFLFWAYKQKSSWKYVVKVGAIISLAIVLGFSILPKQLKCFTVSRILGLSPVYIQANGCGPIYEKILNNDKPLPLFNGPLFGQSRWQILETGSKVFLKNPFGLGFRYWENTPLFVGHDGKKEGAHSLFLGAGLVGGFGALLAVFLITTKFLEKLKRLSGSTTAESKGLILAAIGLLISGLFLDTLLFRNFWFILGIVTGLVASQKE